MSTDAQKRASTNYNRKQDNIMIRPSKEEGATIRAAAAAAGKSVQGYVLEAVREKMERERAGSVPAGAGSPEGTDTQRAGVMVFSEGAPDDNSSSRLSSLTPPDSTTGQPDDEPEFIKVFKRLGAMSPEELDKQLGTDPESIERYREQMERKRQRLAELNAKAGGLSRAEEAERRRLMVECKSYPTDGDSTQE